MINLSLFYALHIFRSIIKDRTCYENLDTPLYIDLILTSCPNNFQKSSISEARLPDFHETIMTGFKSKAPQQSANIISH